jgi:hypothetical protein
MHFSPRNPGIANYRMNAVSASAAAAAVAAAAVLPQIPVVLPTLGAPVNIPPPTVVVAPQLSTAAETPGDRAQRIMDLQVKDDFCFFSTTPYHCPFVERLKGNSPFSK